jgi:hypothetical protein
MSAPDDDLRDQLPGDLDATGFVGPYQFPDNSRRRWPAVIYVALAAACWLSWFAAQESPLVNDGLAWAGALLAVFAVYSFASSWRMTVDETGALVRASGAAGFAVGHASAQQVWRGVRSRPTWRVLCYSSENPPVTRALVLIDAIDGRVVESLVEANPEDPRTQG